MHARAPRTLAANPAAEVIGRERELAQLGDMLAAAVGGSGSICLITGEPGVGKTALATAFAAGAGERVDVLWGACWAADIAPAYWPWRQALRSLVAERSVGELSAELGTAVAHTALLVPELGLGAPRDPEPWNSRFALFEGVATLLAAAGGQRPIAVVLDDLHAADKPSLALLEFLGRALVTARVLLIGTARVREAALREQSGVSLARVGAKVRHLPLLGLRREHVAQLVAARTPEASESFVEALHERTNGNPFFIDELLALADSVSAAGPAEALPVPQAVRDAVLSRLAPIGRSALDLLGAASVIGLEFSLATLSLAACVQPSEAIELLEEPRAEGLVLDVERSGDLRFAFRHALVRDTLYDGLPSDRRLRLHRAVGEALELRHGHLAERPLAALAHHFAHAVPLVPVERARDYAEQAGDRAMAVSAWEEAERHYGQALRLQDQLPNDAERAFELRLALGRARARSGDPEAARPILIEAARVARELGAARRFALAVVELGAVGLPAEYEDRVLVGLLEEALELLDERPSDLRARVLARLAVQLYWSDASERRTAIVDEARGIAAGLVDPTARLEVLAQLDLATSGPETPEHVTALDELLELAARAEDPEAELQVRIWRAAALIQLGELREAAAEVEAYARLSARVQQPRWEWYAPLLRGVLALVEGRLEEGERLRDEAALIASQVRGSTAPHLIGAHVASTRWVQGRLSELLEQATELTTDHPRLTPWRCVRAAALADAGRDFEARDELERLVTDEGLALRFDTAFLSSCALLAHAACRLGDADAARVLYDALAPYAGHNATLVSGGFLGPVARHLGVLAATFGDRDRALEHLAAARRAAERGHMCAILEWIDADEEALMGTVAVDHPAPWPDSTPRTALLRRDGEYWTVSHGGRELRLRHSKGLTYLAQLLRNPGVELHSLELVRADAAEASPSDGDLGPTLDAEAKAAYRAHMEDLDAEIEEAERFGDIERAARRRKELEEVKAQLVRAIGLGGRDRRLGSTSERARVNATRAISRVLDRISDHDAALGHELRATVTTGTYCVHRPDPTRPVRWEVEDR